MIVTNYELQTIACTVCREVVEIRRSMLMNDQHALLEKVDEIKHDHRECSADPDNPERAALNRKFRKNIEREMARMDKTTQRSAA